MLGDICPGPCSSRPRELTPNGNGIFFTAADGSTGRELWQSAGVSGGASRVEDLLVGPESSVPHGLTFVDGMLLFAASDAAGGVELWQSDGSAGGTFRVQDIHPGAGSSSPANFVFSCPNVVFSATDGVHGFEPWALAVAQGVEVELEPQVLTGSRTFTACRRLVAGGGVQLAPGAAIVLRAGEDVVLEDGFVIDSGAVLEVRLEPALAR
ncbi:MAG: hypothetical protein R3325_04100 [Thermoanaerobaculia bacterium]|nr:hypothetical protein [Thermoanaerobaculia bacterium]